MPKPRSKSKPRSEMSAVELEEARSVDAINNSKRTSYSSFDCTQGELKSLNAIWDHVNNTPTLRALIIRADDHHRGRIENRGKTTPIKDRVVPRAAIQRLIIRSGISNLLLDFPMSIDDHLITLGDNHDHRRELRCYLLDYIHDQHPDATNTLLTFTAGNIEYLNTLIDGRLMSLLLIRPNTSDLNEWMSRCNSIEQLLSEFRSHMPTNPVALPFINPYSDKISI